MKELYFTVDSTLLRELGERLVGRPHIAVAELVKNSYDADATKVVIRVREDAIEVTDNGHGMDLKEFTRFWMRIGSPHKQEHRVSREFGRPLTGSKGIGRLAVQFLARRVELHTVPKVSAASELIAYVDWNQAVQAGELTKAKALYEQRNPVTTFPEGIVHGTSILLTKLNQAWHPEDIVNLAREIWWLQPPFRSNPLLKSDSQKQFTVELESPEEASIQEFGVQMRAYLGIWHARIVGKLSSDGSIAKGPDRVRLMVQFEDGQRATWKYRPPNDLLSATEFEIRVFHLKYRQRHGIAVDVARDYLKTYGGVHVYDGGFHLPYYGPENDWLDIEIDHSHRLSKSRLLPEQLQVAEGMTYLPTQSRLLGVVHVDTASEQQKALRRGVERNAEYLKIQVSRDRLVDNKAYRALQHVVRTALDFYAMQEKRRALEEAEAQRPVEPVRQKFVRVDEVLAHHEHQIPKPVYKKLREQVRDAIDASESEAEAIAQKVGLLGALATAGICSLAYEHEVRKQLVLLEGLAGDLTTALTEGALTQNWLREIGDRLTQWIERARGTRALFAYLIDDQNREKRIRLKAASVIRDVKGQLGFLMRGVEIEVGDIPESIRLPKASLAEWSAVFQNVFINAINAMLDSGVKLISVSSRNRGRARALLIQDTGCGVDLDTSEELFEPFVRRMRLSAERRALGLGGGGLGLAIVRMIANNIGCRVGFVKPDTGFSTAFQLLWTETSED